MLWFYVSGLSVLAGAEMNAEIEHASPYGKDPGEKVPGQRKKIGSAAARASEERQRNPQRPRAPSPLPRPGVPPEPASVWFGGLAYFVTRWIRKREQR